MSEQELLQEEPRIKSSQTLRDITKPVQDHLSEFRVFFKGQVQTDVYLLDAILRYLLRQKGKEIRPSLVFMSARMFGDITERSYIAATMIELLHTATLIHDDVVDESDQRRGYSSINRLWKNKAGVLLGDFLLSKGLLIALDAKEYELLQILSGAVRKMSEGELRQLKTARLFNMTEERYFQIISEKTASLISACCECGVRSVTNDPHINETMKEVGLTIGLAFQIKDDLLDYGLDDIGKPRRNDIKERKVTLPLIKAMEGRSSAELRYIRRKMRKRKKNASDIREIVEFVHEHDGIRKSEERMMHYADKAESLLASLPCERGQEDFTQLISFIINRKI